MQIIFFVNILIFLYMVYEDFRYQTVDIRMCLLLFAASNVYFISADSDFSHYYLNLMFGACTYLSLFMLSAKKVNSEIKYELKEEGTYYQSFLPSILLACIVYICFIFYIFPSSLVWKIFWITFMASFHFNPISGVMILILIAMVFLKCRWIYNNKKSGSKIIYGFSDGDVIVCILLTGLIGWLNFMCVFLFAVLIHITIAMLFKINKIRKR